MAVNAKKLDQHLSFNHLIKSTFDRYLTEEGITEICINRPNEIFFEKNQEWLYDEIDLSYQQCKHLATAIAAYKEDKIDQTKPILSAMLLGGERAQVIMPPACERNTISLTIRRHSTTRFTYEQYEVSGFFSEAEEYGQASNEDDDLISLYKEHQWRAFIELAVKKKKNIVIAGATGSGKTTFMKTMVDSIPSKERIITIEDTQELKLNNHPNHVHLLYPSEAKEGDIITASSLLKCCMRMKPDRILLAELRGAETFDFFQAMTSGHRGSITSIHAGSVDETFERMANYMTAHPQGLAIPYATIVSGLRKSVDIVLSIAVHNKKRFIREVYFKEIL